MHRPARLLAAGVLGLLLASGGCAEHPAGFQRPAPVPSAPAPSAPSGSAASAAAAQEVLANLTAAARAADRPGFDRWLSARDPGFAARAAALYANLSTLPLAELSWRAEPRRELPAPDRRHRLGPDAWLQQVTVTWRFAGESRRARHVSWLTFVPEPTGTRLAGNADLPEGVGLVAVPVWWHEPVEARRAGSITVVGSRGRPLGRWLARSRLAAAAVRHRLSGPHATGWSGELVVEVPASRQAFERVLGVATGSYRKIAAAAWAEHPDVAEAAVRIVVNPELAAQLGEQGLAVLLTHETTHVATRSVESPAPTWLVEGFADWVAYDAYPGLHGRAAADLLEAVAADGPPAALPADQAFEPEAHRLDQAYAQAWLACRLIADVHGRSRLNALYAAVDAGTPLDRALAEELGTDLDTVTRDWRAYLTDLARSR